MKTILVPVDLSPATAHVCDAACSLAKLIKARLVFLNVFQPPPVVANEFGTYVPEMQGTLLDSSRTYAQGRLKQLVERCRQRRIQARGFFLIGAPVFEILARSRRDKSAYIVIGSHGHTAFYDLVVGGTTHGVLRGAKCPVMVVPIAPAGRKRRAK